MGLPKKQPKAQQFPWCLICLFYLGNPKNVRKTIINHPFRNSLYHLSMVIWGMGYYCFSLIKSNKHSLPNGPPCFKLPPSSSRHCHILPESRHRSASNMCPCPISHPACQRSHYLKGSETRVTSVPPRHPTKKIRDA